ncbi:hypothetical protein EKO27_g11506 [Xylaria grammica]|uniref:Zn(2)-C6 fungal-type domain-containing protein n=1 Tax=Xylaria grammica TaxID=363999 RepID=A0A439CNF0_9PEZI|nr:hypothetical protein EKO27_g11506 [Xylaria grammica]
MDMAGLVSPSEAEKRANVAVRPASASSPSAIPAADATSSTTAASTATAAPQKLRSCVVCRSRKVRCDKESPCSNCRRAGIPCVIPSADRPPRWARRLERFAHNAAAGERSAPAGDPPTTQVMERLRNLESLVKDLSSQLEQAHALSNSTGNSPASSTNDRDGENQTGTPLTAGSLQLQFGRLVLSGAAGSLDGIKMETQHLAEAELHSSEDEGRPENINQIVQIAHMPTVNKMARRSRGSGGAPMTPSNEALMFSIYYAAIVSMEDDDVLSNFGSAKADLSLKYRLGFEHAVARADFLNMPDIVLVQAFSIFLLLVRLHDSPRCVWMLTGLVIRMAQSLGLQRDGSHFQHLTPFEVHERRRVWYAICSLDVRASEDQGTDFTIQKGSFDTRLPLNIDDEDIDVDAKEMPIEREGITDMTVSIAMTDISNISRRMIAPGVSLEEQNRLLGTIYATLEERYLRFSTEPGNIAYWVLAVATRLVTAKLTLFTHLPVLFSSPGESFSDEIRNKLLVAAIEVAEFNHALNSEKAARQWRWVYQTYTHWHAIVYLLIDICRRPWSPIVDRAWIALHSPWLIPAKSRLDKGLRTWVPLRKLTLKARKHRESELGRLRGDASAARRLEMDDRKLPVPSTVGSVSATAAADISRGRWRKLVGVSEMPEENTQIETTPLPPALALANSAQIFPDDAGTGPDDTTRASSGSQPYSNPLATREPVPTAPEVMALDQPSSHGPQYNVFSPTTVDWSDGHPESGGLLGWFWADCDPNVDVFADAGADAMDFNVDFGEMDWQNWVESAKGMEMDAHANARPR